MRSNSLIDDLVGGLTPVRPRRAWQDATMLLALALAELGIYLWLGRMRDDMPMAMNEMSWWWKVSGLAAMALVATLAAVRALDPSRSPRRGLRVATGLGIVLLIVGWAIDAMGAGSASVIARLDWRHGLDCVFAMLVLSVPPALGFGLLMRRGAATDPKGTALAAGLASAAWGSFVFAFACPSDDPFYIAVWYIAAMALVTGLVRLLLPMMSRW